MNNNNFDVAIIGGGIVGLATAYKLQIYSPKLKIVVLEKEKELAFHQTGRNSGVIHSGLYYKPGSFKAKNCVEGRKQLVDFALKNSVEHDVCGKIVLAVNEKESAYLIKLKKNGEVNGLKGMVIMSPNEFHKIEPYAVGVSALWVPESGIINYKQTVQKFAEKIVEINPMSKIICSCKVTDFSDNHLKTSKGDFYVKNNIFCAGLFSDRLAEKDKFKLNTKIVGFRGDYYQLSQKAKNKVNNLIYPVPNPEFPFLGVHFTRMTDGSVECGPNAVFTFKREGYNKTAFSFKDTLDSLFFSGTIRLFINHWKFGVNEYRRAFSKRLFLRDLQTLIPSLSMKDIIVGKSGVRAMALASNGEIIDDFKIVMNKKNIHVINAPSPAATACLSIADNIVSTAIKEFKLKL
ncbi:MAG: L-2-hydroxyglutarate oxidase [Flavobacteriales bacterium]|jgi:L-2-hydroxyglutarate oxidase|tara:strand:+ start:1584 stop:2795 length:1212 start_codon:yes stop_codon:yes gene_type:complete